MTRDKDSAAPPRSSFLTEKDLADIDERNAAANRLRTQFDLGPPGQSELEQLVAEVRYWRRKWRRLSNAPGGAKK